jgi:hypothetical protein
VAVWSGSDRGRGLQGRHRSQLGELSQVLGNGGEKKLVPGAGGASLTAATSHFLHIFKLAGEIAIAALLDQGVALPIRRMIYEDR